MFAVQEDANMLECAVGVIPWSIELGVHREHETERDTLRRRSRYVNRSTKRRAASESLFRASNSGRWVDNYSRGLLPSQLSSVKRMSSIPGADYNLTAF
jgi:hypothetical protein